MLVLVFVNPICTSESCRATDRWLVYLQAERISVCFYSSVCMHVSIQCFVQMRLDYTITSPAAASIPSIVLGFLPFIIQVEGQNKGRGYCGSVCASVCICVCALHVGGGCVKEEVLSGTEAFCRCCREEGVNGKFCGYQSYSSLWLAKVCHMWPHPNSVWRRNHWKIWDWTT